MRQGRDSGGHRQEVDAKTVVGRWDARGVSSVPCTRVQTIIGEKTELGVGWEDFLLIPTADATQNTNDEMCMAVLGWGTMGNSGHTLDILGPGLLAVEVTQNLLLRY